MNNTTSTSDKTAMNDLVKELKALIQAGHYNEGLTRLIAAGEELPTTTDTCVLGAILLFRIDKSSLAVCRLENWLHDHPNDAESLRTLGHVMLGIGNSSKALEAFRKAQAIEPMTVISEKITMLEVTISKNERQDAQLTARIQPKAETAFVPEMQSMPRTGAEHIGNSTRFFRDASDKATLAITLLHLILPLILLRQGFDRHPLVNLWNHNAKSVFQALGAASGWVNMEWVVALLCLPLSLYIVNKARKNSILPRKNEVVVCSDTRRLWTHHTYLIPLTLTTAASLWSNMHNYDTAAEYLGILAIACALRCLWLFMPGVRSQTKLFKNNDKPTLNRLVITEGIWRRHEFLAKHIQDIQLVSSLWHALSLKEDIELQLSDGTTFRLEAPSSLDGTRHLASKINELVNEGKTVVVR